MPGSCGGSGGDCRIASQSPRKALPGVRALTRRRRGSMARGEPTGRAIRPRPATRSAATSAQAHKTTRRRAPLRCRWRGRRSANRRAGAANAGRWPWGATRTAQLPVHRQHADGFTIRTTPPRSDLIAGAALICTADALTRTALISIPLTTTVTPPLPSDPASRNRETIAMTPDRRPASSRADPDRPEGIGVRGGARANLRRPLLIVTSCLTFARVQRDAQRRRRARCDRDARRRGTKTLEPDAGHTDPAVRPRTGNCR